MKPIKTVEQYLKLLEQKRAIDEQIEITRHLVMDEMAQLGLKQIKTDTATTTIAKRVTPVVDEVGFRSWATEQPELAIDEFYVQSLDKKKVADYAKHVLRETGEIVPFISTNETEYLSVRAAKQEDK
jgi:ribosomal 30S subunit maturation factor RimM